MITSKETKPRNTTGLLFILLLIAIGLNGRPPGTAAKATVGPKASAAIGTTTRISVSSDGVTGNNQSLEPSISDDGRFVAFASLASNLVPGDTNNTWDVFVHDRHTGQTERVSVAADGTEGNDQSWHSSISGNGRYVVFTSFANNLAPEDDNFSLDIYLKDRITGQVDIISTLSTGEAAGYSYDTVPAVSYDGRFVVFSSYSPFLVDNDTNEKVDVFLHDRQTQQIRRVSVGSGGTQGNHDSFGPLGITADGQEVFFSSWSDTLVPGDTNNTLDLFAHFWPEPGVTERISVSSDGTQGNSDTGGGDPSADGLIVAMNSKASNLVPNDNNVTSDAFVRYRETGVTQRVSVTSGGEEDYGFVPSAKISPDGHFVVFSSTSSLLVANDNNGVMDVFIHDWVTGRTDRVSVSSSGTEANEESFYLSDVSRDGRAVAFTSKATNLGNGGDSNGTWDVFVHEYAPCYALFRDQSGGGMIPTASPQNSVGCEPHTYHSGEVITLKATLNNGWRVVGWCGTDNDASTAITNTLTMPAYDHTICVHYEPPDTFRSYVPFVARYPQGAQPSCFAEPGEMEDNDTLSTANGPLCSGQDYRGRPNDTWDFFMFDTVQTGTITAELATHYGGGVQLLLYYRDTSTLVAGGGLQGDGLRIELPNAQPGRYYLVIYSTTPAPQETRLYTLTVNFPDFP